MCTKIEAFNLVYELSFYKYFLLFSVYSKSTRRRAVENYALKTTRFIKGIIVQSLSCVLIFVLPTCRPKYAEVARTT